MTKIGGGVGIFWTSGQVYGALLEFEKKTYFWKEFDMVCKKRGEATMEKRQILKKLIFEAENNH